MEFLTVGTTEFASEVKGQGPDLVFLHPGVGDHRVWSQTTDLLPDYHTFAYDRRGFGFTTSRPEPHSSVGDLVALLAARGMHKAVLVGNSQGGRIAIDIALAYPELVRALVLFGAAVSGAPWPEPSGALRHLHDRIDAAEEANDIDEVNRLEAHLWLDGPESEEYRVRGAGRDLFLDMNGRALRAEEIGDAIPAPSAWGRLSEVHVPTLVVFGDLDVAALREVSRVLVETIPHATYRELPEFAHVPQLEDPSLCAQIIRDFVSGLST